MTRKHYMTLAICSLLIVISLACYGSYYCDYLLPKSFVVGTNQEYAYKELAVKDYLSDDMILFSQNINDVSFVNNKGIATYEYSFDHKDFNGEDNLYSLFINNSLVTETSQTAGTYTGLYHLNYFDVDKNVLCSSDITISFAFYSVQSKLKVTLDYNELPYLAYYFKTDNFIITLAKSSFVMNDRDVVVDKQPTDELTDIDIPIYSGVAVTVEYNDEVSDYTPNSLVYRESLIVVYQAKSKDQIKIKYSSSNKYLVVTTDGEYTVSFDGSYHVISWEGASRLMIEITSVQP